MKHTVGPWSVGEFDLETGDGLMRFDAIWGADDGVSMGTYHVPNRPVALLMSVLGSDEPEANTRLITAAPTMLNALKMAAETVDNVADSLAVAGVLDRKNQQWLYETVAVLNAAIKEATRP